MLQWLLASHITYSTALYCRVIHYFCVRGTKLAGKHKPDGPADARAVQKLSAPRQIDEPDCTSEAGIADVVSHSLGACAKHTVRKLITAS